MLRKIRNALERRHSAVVTAEALVWRFGARGAEMARHAAESPHQEDAHRRHWQAVEQIAERRQAAVQQLDTATRYEAGNRWAHRRGSLVGAAPHPSNALS